MTRRLRALALLLAFAVLAIISVDSSAKRPKHIPVPFDGGEFALIAYLARSMRSGR